MAQKIIIAQWVLDQSLGREFLAEFAGGKRTITGESEKAYFITLESADGQLKSEISAPKSAVIVKGVPDEVAVEGNENLPEAMK